MGKINPYQQLDDCYRFTQSLKKTIACHKNLLPKTAGDPAKHLGHFDSYTPKGSEVTQTTASSALRHCL